MSSSSVMSKMNLIACKTFTKNLLNEPAMLGTFHLYETVVKEHVFIP